MHADVAGSAPAVYGNRQLTQAGAPAASLTPAQTELSELTATEAVARLCARDVTAVNYVQALLSRLDAGWSCINSFQTLNRTKVGVFHLPSASSGQW